MIESRVNEDLDTNTDSEIYDCCCSGNGRVKRGGLYII
jgi:hypothetical protein